MYSIDKYAADAYAAQRKQLEAKLDAFDALKAAYVARERARIARRDLTNDDARGRSAQIAAAWQDLMEADRQLSAALVAAFGEVKGPWE